MKHEQEMRELLINNTIRLIAEGGFEKATTKAITHSGDTLPRLKMNEVYIYRLFGGKEKLYSQAFARLDKEIVFALHSCLEKHHELEIDIKKKLYEAFCDTWSFILNNEEHCRCYIRYYYSVYFKEESLSAHNHLFEEFIVKISPLFKEEADVKSIMHSVFTTTLNFAVRVYNGDLENTDKNKIHIFNVIYSIMMTYLKQETCVEPQEIQFL